MLAAMGRNQLILRPLALHSSLDLRLHLGPTSPASLGLRCPLLASLGQCLSSVLGLAWAVLVSPASIPVQVPVPATL